MNEISQQSVGEHLLFPLFRSLSADYKSKYKKDVWDQFENNLRASAYTAKLTTFFENITRTMPIKFEQQYAEAAMQILNSGLDKQILTWLRDETTYLVLIARMKNEERKEDWKQKQSEKEESDKYPGHPSVYPENEDHPLFANDPLNPKNINPQSSTLNSDK